MFTGIIVSVGNIATISPQGGDFRLKIHSGKLSLTDTALGDSIAVNGICLTAVELGRDHFCADVSNETLSRTTLKSARSGAQVNLELALTPNSRLGGHIVSGHVDGIGTLLQIQPDGRSLRFTFRAPENLAKYIAEKGSVCIDGVSLTVNRVDGCEFDVNIVPHTLQETTLGALQSGNQVNLEADIIARYLERLLLGEAAKNYQGGISEAFLKNSGFTV
jgi:riboflavin synthase